MKATTEDTEVHRGVWTTPLWSSVPSVVDVRESRP